MFSKVVRRTHLYLGLFLCPWMAMYALATMAMNHRDYLRQSYGGDIQKWEIEEERVYQRTFVPEAEPAEIAAEILGDLGLSGPFNANRRNGVVRINRRDPLASRRITYDPVNETLVIERMAFRVPTFLVRLHHRAGYQGQHMASDLWAISIDLVVSAMLLWVLSGLWMWWQMKTTRRMGACCVAVGIGLFSFFLYTI